MEIKESSYEICVRAYIGFLANKIKKAFEHTVIFDLAQMIFQIVATELENADDLFAWFDISEMIDRLEYDDQPFVLNEDYLIKRIKNEAKSFKS